MAQSGFTPILLYGSTTTSNTPSASNLTTTSNGVEVAINATDGKMFYKDNAGVVQVLATKAGANGNVVGPASATANNLVLFDGTTGKLIKDGGQALPTGTLVGTTDSQVLTNKTISVDNNTVSGIAASSFVLSNGSGNIDGAAAQKAIPTGAVVGTTDSQVLTNKTISVDDNTVSGVAASSFVLSNASGNIDGAAAQKVIPAGAVVGTTDSQVLTNKTISVDDNTVSGIAASSFVLSNGSGNIDGAAAQKAIPTGVVVGDTDSQVLTNKTISVDNNTVSGIAASSFVLSNGSGNIDGSAAQKAIPSGAVVGTTDTQTLSDKRINPRSVVAGATSGNLTANGDTTDLYEAEGLTGAVTFLAPSGTPVDGQKLMIRIKDNGTARGITWTTSSGAFREVGITLPTTTVINKVTYVGCVYNATDSFWDAVATVTQA